MTLFEGEPYDSWDVKGLGKREGMVAERSWRWDWGVWGGWGYRHVRTLGDLRTLGEELGEEWGGFSDEEGDEGDEGGSEERRPGWKGEDREARCYCFYVPDMRHEGEVVELSTVRKKKWKRGGDESDSD